MPEFEQTGVYVLSGFSDNDDDDLPTIYIGEGDGIRQRIDAHAKNKDFWSWGIAFVSTNNGLNKAHAQWLEYALVAQATKANRCKMQNGNFPQAPNLGPGEKADTERFFREILRILPLAGLKAFEVPQAVAKPAVHSGGNWKAEPQPQGGIDTIIVPAKPEGFERVFLSQNCWFAVRIAAGKLDKIKWIAVYQSQPVSAITYVAPVDRIEPYGEEGKFKIIFSEPAKPIPPVHFGSIPSGAMQGIRYTTREKLLKAKEIKDL